MKNRTFAGALCIIGASVIWGCTGLVVRKLAAAGLSAIETLALRSLFGMIFAGIYMLIFQRSKLKIKLKDIWCFVGTGILNMMLAAMFNFTGIGKNYASISVMGALTQTGPVFAMLFGIILFKERFTVRKCIAMMLTFTGCCLVSGIGTDDHISWMGLLMGLGSGIGYSMYSVFGRYGINRGYDGWTITFYSFVFCTLGCCFITDWNLIVGAVVVDTSVLWWIMAIGLFEGFIAYVLYTLGLQRIETGKAAILCSLELVTATVIGVLFYNDPITVMILLGVLIIITGIVVSSSGKSAEKQS